ncbi:MAG: NAD-glutamate dehydrogenase [Alteromonadaceae bacterium]|nr:NAD-glutamate dehydrogenase [Alteromonadaceae bacterium]
MTVPHNSVLLDKVFQLIQEKTSSTRASLITEFGEQLFSNIAHEDLIGRSDSDTYGAMLSLWQHFSEYDGAAPFIKAFNPKITKDGWQSEHTIVEIIVPDKPFLVDSIRMCLARLNITAHLFLNSPITLKRNAQNEIMHFVSKNKASCETCIKETVFLLEIDRQTSSKALTQLTDELQQVLSEVEQVVSDWAPMQNKLHNARTSLYDIPFAIDPNAQQEAIEFVDWLAKHNFTLMGYRYYKVHPEEGDYIWQPQDETSLGIMLNTTRNRDRRISNLPSSARKATLSQHPLILTKTTSVARVHRPTYLDYVGIKEFNTEGQVVGEHRFLGLYSAALYNSSVINIPVLKQKIAQVCQLMDVEQGTHAFKATINILETYPREELLHSSSKELARIVKGILQMQERGFSRMFTRKDAYGRFISCLVYVPRERYNTALRIATQQYLQKAFNSEQPVEFTTYFSESVYARTHYIVRVADNNVDFAVSDIEQNVSELSKSWDDRLINTIKSAFGEAKSVSLIKQFSNAFSQSYMDNHLPSAALADINKVCELSDDLPLTMLFYRPQEIDKQSKAVRLKLYHRDEPIHLSDVLPMLENFGLRVIDETPYQVKASHDGRSRNYWVMDFSMLHDAFPPTDMALSQELFQSAFAKVWDRHLEDDAFNRLILSANISGRKVTILRAYAKYMRQTGSLFSIDYIANTVAAYPDISALLIDLFEYRFTPDKKFKVKEQDKRSQEIISKLDSVSNLDDDRIIRRYLDMILATVRTNFYQPTQQGNEKAYVSFKLRPELIPDMPLPLPKFEIFVYSPRVEGVHLRGGKVARGGLRWSDRQEDFRTEVLGLVKAQQVKNTVIVPVGAKGGFVCKQPAQGGRDAFIAEGQACYRIFIRSLLDLTDNIIDGAIVPPRQVVRHDEDDPYLVVAADKGTATFSDIANEISAEFDFWLGDAFASGGSVGYDHKKMGITARGAWESVKRHFREIGINCQTTDFTCVGIGDMAGDVFGNGMLLSQHTRLVAAFNHMHIFIDPNPDAAASYRERERLFADPSLNWSNYNTSLMSDGGGIFDRKAKSITLTAQMKKMLNTKRACMTPNELIHELLQMPVDLLWNGGIGTYIKASNESHAEVGDRANDEVRVNGKQIKAKIVGEGGNLGATQLGRIEYAKHGGRINTDFIDNVGGVDCSDNEVNIKILLNSLVKAGDLTLKQRNELLYEMTDNVADLVLDDCYRQTQSISISQLGGAKSLKEQIRFIHGLEKAGDLNRELEFLPSDEDLNERIVDNIGFTRPELSVLISYSKMVLKDDLNVSDITEAEHYNQLLVSAFPKQLQDRYQSQMQDHPLRSEIIATKLANVMINDMGFNFVFRLQEETGSSVSEIAKAYSIVKAVFGMDNVSDEIEQLDNQISADVQLSLFDQIRRALRRGARWFVRQSTSFTSIAEAIDFYRPIYMDLLDNINDYLVDDEASTLLKARDELVAQGVPVKLAYRLAMLSNAFSTFDLAHIVAEAQTPKAVTARLYFQLGSQLQLHWFLNQINRQAVDNHWQALARSSYREELDHQQRAITQSLIKGSQKLFSCQDADALLDSWMAENTDLISRWCGMMSEFKTSKQHEFAKFSVALRELLLLSNKIQH